MEAQPPHRETPPSPSVQPGDGDDDSNSNNICKACKNLQPVYRRCDDCLDAAMYFCKDDDCWAIPPASGDTVLKWKCSRCRGINEEHAAKFCRPADAAEARTKMNEELSRNFTKRMVDTSTSGARGFGRGSGRGFGRGFDRGIGRAFGLAARGRGTYLHHRGGAGDAVVGTVRPVPTCMLRFFRPEHTSQHQDAAFFSNVSDPTQITRTTSRTNVRGRYPDGF